MFKCKVLKKEEGLSLKDFLLNIGVAKNKLNYFIDSKLIYVNGEVCYKRDHLLKYNDLIEIDTTDFDNIDYPPVRYNLDIIYEDDYLLVVNKPKGVIIYPENKENANTMANYIAYYYHKTGQNYAIRHVHRLDKDTTGILLYAKDVITHSYLTKLFEEKKVKKEYYALVEGIILEDGVVNKRIARDRHKDAMRVSDKGQEAHTIYHVEKIDFDKKQTLLRVEIKTGRTHQIRVHMSSINHPLVGDTLYGSKTSADMFLKCYHQGFYNRFQEKWVDFYLPLDERG